MLIDTVFLSTKLRLAIVEKETVDVGPRCKRPRPISIC